MTILLQKVDNRNDAGIMDGSDDILNSDLRPAETLATLSMFSAFFNRVEAQLADAEVIDRAQLPCEDWDIEERLHRDFFEELMIPYSRYSAAVLLFMIVEVRLSAECDAIGRERKLKLRCSDFRGSRPEQAKIFLSKVAEIQVGDYCEWSALMDLQRIRDCIVHCAGTIEKLNEKDRRRIEYLIGQNIGLSRTVQDTIGISDGWIRSCIAELTKFFERLFRDFGWKP